MKSFKISLILIFTGLIFQACKTSVQTLTTTTTRKSVLPFEIAVVQPGDTINGGAFLSLTAKSSIGSWSSQNSFSSIVGLSYFLWPGIISVFVDGNSLNQYQEDVSTSTPLGSHIWNVVADSSDGIPAIHDTIRAVPSIHLSSPSMFDTVTRPFTLSWNASTDTTSHIIIMVTGVPPNYGIDTTFQDTLGTTYIPVLDNGSYTFTSSDLNHVPTGWMAKIAIVRLVQDFQTISTLNYLFVNACEENTYLVIN